MALSPMKYHRFAREVLMTATATLANPGPTPAIVPTLRDHLSANGLREFSEGRKYRRWMRGKIGATKCATIDWYRNEAHGFHYQVMRTAMYDEIGAPGVFGPVASERYGAMLASGEAVLPFLPAAGRILDVGCATGVLTSWWAMQVPGATVTGCDNTPAAVSTANQGDAHAGNVSFVVADATLGLPDGPFSLVISTQSVVENADELPSVLGHIASVLAPDGTYLAIEPLSTLRGVRMYTEFANDAGMVLQSLGMVPYLMFGALQAYPVLEYRRVDGLPIASSVDITEAYATAYRAIFGKEPPTAPHSAGSPG